MHADGLDGLHELVREAARPHWAAGDGAGAVRDAWTAVAHACPDGEAWFVDPTSADARTVQNGVQALLSAMATLAAADEPLATASPQVAFELLSGLSLCARYVEQAVSAEQMEDVIHACAGLGAQSSAAAIERALSAVPRAAWPLVTTHLLDTLVAPATTATAGGLRAAYLRLVETDEASAAAAAARCGELLSDPVRRRHAIVVLSPSVIGRLDAANRVVIPAVLALELQDGGLEGEHVVRGWAGIDAAQLLWDDFLPAARAQVVEAIGFGLQNGEPELQAYLTRAVCALAPLLVGRERADLTRGLARALVRRNAVDAADQVVAAAATLPGDFCAQLLGAIAVQQAVGPQDAATTVVAALRDTPAARAS